MTNLLQETIQDIENSGHNVQDIVFIGSSYSGYSCTWNEFLLLADIEYNSGYGAQEVASDLTIVFRDGITMWRSEYDGSEWWEYVKPVESPKEQKKITKLTGGMWATLADLNDKPSPTK